MKIEAFTSDKAKVETWLSELVDSLTKDDVYASYWFHPGSNGFGVVIVDHHSGHSGEFHLFADGRVSANVEDGSELLANGWHQVSHFHEFEGRFEDFKAKIVAREST
jgi:hypothetical protein